MKRPPESFISDYAVFRERMDWTERCDLDEDLVQSQLVYCDMRDFLDRWQGKVGVAELEASLVELLPIVDKIGRLIERKYLEALHDLLEKRHSVLIEPLLFQADMAFLGIMKHVPDSLRPGLEKIFRES